MNITKIIKSISEAIYTNNITVTSDRILIDDKEGDGWLIQIDYNCCEIEKMKIGIKFNSAKTNKTYFEFIYRSQDIDYNWFENKYTFKDFLQNEEIYEKLEKRFFHILNKIGD